MKHLNTRDSMRRYRRSMRRRRRSARRLRGVFGNIDDCGVGITPQMCNRVTNHGDMGTFSKQVMHELQMRASAFRHNFHRRDLKFSDIVPDTITIFNHN